MGNFLAEHLYVILYSGHVIVGEFVIGAITSAVVVGIVKTIIIITIIFWTIINIKTLLIVTPS